MHEESLENKTDINSELVTLKDRYELLIKARNFHYENFNKWMSYFYLMIGSLFVAWYYVESKSNCDEYLGNRLLICSLGFIISILWFWANKGYYYWNINFIMLINHFEKNLLQFDEDKRVYFVFANKFNNGNYTSPLKGANISTSKISILLSYIITLFWGSAVLHFVFEDYIICKFLTLLVASVFSIVIIYVLSKYLAPLIVASDIENHPDLNLDFKSKEKNNS